MKQQQGSHTSRACSGGPASGPCSRLEPCPRAYPPALWRAQATSPVPALPVRVAEEEDGAWAAAALRAGPASSAANQVRATCLPCLHHTGTRASTPATFHVRCPCVPALREGHWSRDCPSAGGGGGGAYGGGSYGGGRGGGAYGGGAYGGGYGGRGGGDGAPVPFASRFNRGDGNQAYGGGGGGGMYGRGGGRGGGGAANSTCYKCSQTGEGQRRQCCSAEERVSLLLHELVPGRLLWRTAHRRPSSAVLPDAQATGRGTARPAAERGKGSRACRERPSSDRVAWAARPPRRRCEGRRNISQCRDNVALTWMSGWVTPRHLPGTTAELRRRPDHCTLRACAATSASTVRCCAQLPKPKKKHGCGTTYARAGPQLQFHGPLQSSRLSDCEERVSLTACFQRLTPPRPAAPAPSPPARAASAVQGRTNGLP
jgi:hypothetical protein